VGRRRLRRAGGGRLDVVGLLDVVRLVAVYEKRRSPEQDDDEHDDCGRCHDRIFDARLTRHTSIIGTRACGLNRTDCRCDSGIRAARHKATQVVLI
jgi:hypothetical protein